MEATLRYRGRLVTDEDITFIRQLIVQNPDANRHKLSRLLCEAWNWRQPNGYLRDMVCRGLMLELHRGGYIELPKARQQVYNPFVQRKKPAVVAVDKTPIVAKLGELQPLTFCQVRRTSNEALFNSLIEQYHYLGYTQPVGEHLKYLVYTKDRPVACLALSSAPRHIGPRDRFIGWSQDIRRKHIHLMAYNTRFLILPWVRAAHLASHLLGRMVRRLSDDWFQMYKHPIYYVETFIDTSRFLGTCYYAANWIFLGKTTGRGKDDQTHRPNRTLKDVLGYPLTKQFRKYLGVDA